MNNLMHDLNIKKRLLNSTIKTLATFNESPSNPDLLMQVKMIDSTLKSYLDGNSSNEIRYSLTDTLMSMLILAIDGVFEDISKAQASSHKKI